MYIYTEVTGQDARMEYNQGAEIIMMSSEFDQPEGMNFSRFKKRIDKRTFDDAVRCFSSMTWLETYGYHIRFYIKH